MPRLRSSSVFISLHQPTKTHFLVSKDSYQKVGLKVACVLLVVCKLFVRCIITFTFTHWSLSTSLSSLPGWLLKKHLECLNQTTDQCCATTFQGLNNNAWHVLAALPEWQLQKE